MSKEFVAARWAFVQGFAAGADLTKLRRRRHKSEPGMDAHWKAGWDAGYAAASDAEAKYTIAFGVGEAMVNASCTCSTQLRATDAYRIQRIHSSNCPVIGGDAS